MWKSQLLSALGAHRWAEGQRRCRWPDDLLGTPRYQIQECASCCCGHHQAGCHHDSQFDCSRGNGASKAAGGKRHRQREQDLRCWQIAVLLPVSLHRHGRPLAKLMLGAAAQANGGLANSFVYVPRVLDARRLWAHYFCEGLDRREGSGRAGEGTTCPQERKETQGSVPRWWKEAAKATEGILPALGHAVWTVVCLHACHEPQPRRWRTNKSIGCAPTSVKGFEIFEWGYPCKIEAWNVEIMLWHV